MSDKLLCVISDVQKRIANHPEAFRKQQQTISSLINPILSALGWDITDHQHVEYERKISSGEADIALKRARNPVVIIEAKSLTGILGNTEEEQLVRYCSLSNVMTGVLTNGDEWRVYHIYRPKQSGESIELILLFKFHLGTKEESAEFASRHLSLFNFDSINEVDTKKRSMLLNNYWQMKGKDELLEHLLNNYTGKFINSFCDWSGLQIRPKDIREEVRSLLREKLYPEQKHPDIRISQQSQQSLSQPIPPNTGRAVVLDGKRIEIKYANEVLIQTAEWLVEKGLIRPDECPIRISKWAERYVIHTHPLQPSGGSFRHSRTLSNGLFIEPHGSKDQVIRSARLLLQRYGYRPTTLRLIGFDD